MKTQPVRAKSIAELCICLEQSYLQRTRILDELELKVHRIHTKRSTEGIETLFSQASKLDNNRLSFAMFQFVMDTQNPQVDYDRNHTKIIAEIQRARKQMKRGFEVWDVNKRQ